MKTYEEIVAIITNNPTFRGDIVTDHETAQRIFAYIAGIEEDPRSIQFGQQGEPDTYTLTISQ